MYVCMSLIYIIGPLCNGFKLLGQMVLDIVSKLGLFRKLLSSIYFIFPGRHVCYSMSVALDGLSAYFLTA
jgi:hypothetical protein